MTPRPSQTHCASHCAVPQAPRGAGSPASLARVGPRRPEVCVFPHRGGLRRPRLVKYEFSKETRSPLEGNESPQPGMKGGADGSAGHSRDGRVCAPTDPRHQHEPPAMPPGVPLAAKTTLSVSLSRPTSRPPRRCSTRAPAREARRAALAAPPSRIVRKKTPIVPDPGPAQIRSTQTLEFDIALN